MNHRKGCFQFEHEVQGLVCTEGMYMHKLLEPHRHYWAQFELLQISSWLHGSRWLETLFKPVTNTSAGVPPHKWSHHLFPSKQPLHRGGRNTASLHLIRVLKKKYFFRPLGFYLSHLFLQRGEIHLCSAVLRKHIRTLKYQAEMLIKNELCIGNRNNSWKH